MVMIVYLGASQTNALFIINAKSVWSNLDYYREAFIPENTVLFYDGAPSRD